MEFDVVFLIGMTEGTFPDYRAKGNALEEERRNAFVAVTRSKRLLYLTYPKTRVMPWGDVKRQEASRYIRQICD
jgi:DNA helicase-2/ATP-dependent DNA helicase PcrA